MSSDNYNFFSFVSSAFEGNSVKEVQLEPAKIYEVEDPNHPAHKFRQISGANIRKQGLRMLNRTNKKLSPASVGDCVAVFTSEFDRGKADPPNIIGIITAVDENNKYTVTTTVGTIKDRLERNCFEILKYKAPEIKDAPNVFLSMKEIITLLSVGDGQGFVRCNCKMKCDTARCKCRSEKRICNSACHKNNSSCVNHV